MEFLTTLWNYTHTSAPFLMFGLLISGLIHSFISTDRIKKSLGQDGVWGVIKASLYGIPLPLCSCAVIPTAATLKKNGASNSATSSFLISTPESGIDSIAMTYGMMDLPMTIIRPIAAFFSAFFAGILQMIFNSDEILIEEEKKSCCSKKKEVHEMSFMEKTKKMFHFAFIELIEDMAFWLFLGIVAGAFIDFMVPDNFFQGLDGWYGRFAILAIGIPLYICASATTPIAASLVMKGMSPGMALLVLLVGPATNISNILVMGKYIGKKGVLINVIAIAVVALIMSFATDFYYEAYGNGFNFRVSTHDHEHVALWETVLAVIFTVLLMKPLLLKELPKFLKSGKAGCCD